MLFSVHPHSSYVRPDDPPRRWALLPGLAYAARNTCEPQSLHLYRLRQPARRDHDMYGMLPAENVAQRRGGERRHHRNLRPPINRARSSSATIRGLHDQPGLPETSHSRAFSKPGDRLPARRASPDKFDNPLRSSAST